MQSQIKQGQGSALKRGIPSWLWWVSAFSLTFLILFVSLGRWQLDRAAEKQQLLSQIEERRQAAPFTAAQLPFTAEELAAAEFRSVRLRGHFESGVTLMLDNRIRDGRAGVEVLGLFRVAGLPAPILVNRGWLGFVDGVRGLPAPEPVMHELVIDAEVYRPQPPPLRLAESAPRRAGQAWLLQELSPEMLAQQLDRELAPVVLRLRDGSAAAFRTEWPGIMVSPAKHQAYAVQWFAMALVLFGLTVWSWKKWWSQERE